MKSYILTFVLAVLVVLASLVLRQSVYGTATNAVGSNNPSVAIGPGPFPYPPSSKLAIGPGPFPYPPSSRVAIGPGPFPYPPTAVAIGPGPFPYPPSFGAK